MTNNYTNQKKNVYNNLLNQFAVIQYICVIFSQYDLDYVLQKFYLKKSIIFLIKLQFLFTIILNYKQEILGVSLLYFVSLFFVKFLYILFSHVMHFDVFRKKIIMIVRKGTLRLIRRPRFLNLSMILAMINSHCLMSQFF